MQKSRVIALHRNVWGGKSGHQQAPRFTILRAKWRPGGGNLTGTDSATENKLPCFGGEKVKR